MYGLEQRAQRERARNKHRLDLRQAPPRIDRVEVLRLPLPLRDRDVVAVGKLQQVA